MSSLAHVSDDDRLRVAELLQTACGDGRIDLDEFTSRVGDVWEAETDVDLARATAGLAPAPTTGLAAWVPPILGLRSLTAFGTSTVEIGPARPDGVVEVSGTCLFGDVRLTVPDGVAVEMSGISLFGTHEVAVRPTPRTAATPVVRVGVHVLFGSLRITQRAPHDA